ncbi:hypothetical protein MRX96_015569 [Rhipicephalus microplus]
MGGARFIDPSLTPLSSPVSFGTAEKSPSYLLLFSGTKVLARTAGATRRSGLRCCLCGGPSALDLSLSLQALRPSLATGPRSGAAQSLRVVAFFHRAAGGCDAAAEGSAGVPSFTLPSVPAILRRFSRRSGKPGQCFATPIPAKTVEDRRGEFGRRARVFVRAPRVAGDFDRAVSAIAACCTSGAGSGR